MKRFILLHFIVFSLYLLIGNVSYAQVGGDTVNCLDTCQLQLLDGGGGACTTGQIQASGRVGGSNNDQVTFEYSNTFPSNTKPGNYCLVIDKVESGIVSTKYCQPITFPKGEKNLTGTVTFDVGGTYEYQIINDPNRESAPCADPQRITISSVPTLAPTSETQQCVSDGCCNLRQNIGSLNRPICSGSYCNPTTDIAACPGGGEISDVLDPDKDLHLAGDKGYLEAFKDNLDQATAGTIDNVCAVGPYKLHSIEQNPIDGDADFDKVNKIMSFLKNAADAIYGFAQQFVTLGTENIVPTDFCYDDKIETIPVFSENGRDIVITESDYTSASGQQDLENISDLTSGKKRIFKAYRLLKSTRNIDPDDKDVIFKQIQVLLNGKVTQVPDSHGDIIPQSETALSCICRSKEDYAADLKQQGYVLGVSDDAIPIAKKNNDKSSVLGIMVGEHDYDFSEIDDITGLNLRGNHTLRTDYCTNLSVDERLKKYNTDKIDKCADKLGDTYLSAKQSCGPLLSLKDHQEEHLKCLQCSWLDSGAWTAIGCIHSDFSKTVERLFTIALGFGGLSALGCIIYASFLMQTSAGNPEKTKKAQELITSCIAGLILIIFSVFILRVIGVDILRIPGFIS